MKIKNLLVGSGLVYATGLALYSVFIVKKGKEFEADLDKSPESLDDFITYGGKLKSFNGQTMRDLHLGAFCGGMQLDFSDVITEKDNYRMDVKIISGGFNIIVPDNFRLRIVDHCQFGGIADNTVCNDPDNSILLSVFADIKCGGLNFENTDSE